MSSKLNPRWILKDHFSTFRHHRDDKVSYWDVFVFFIVPGIASCFVGWFVNRISSDGLTMILAALSIFAGLLFNILVLIYGFVPDDTKNLNLSSPKWTLLKEAFANISYTILICIVAIVVVGAIKIFGDSIRRPLEYAVFYILGNFALTLLMILKRVHSVMHPEFEKATKKP